MSVCCECSALSGRRLCVGLIARPEESYRKLCVSECDREASTMRSAPPTGGLLSHGKKTKKVETVTYKTYMAGVLNLRLTLNQLIFSTCLGVECICATPSLEAFCSSSDPVSSEAHWLMPHYRFSHNIVLYTLGLLGVSVVVARTL